MESENVSMFKLDMNIVFAFFNWSYINYILTYGFVEPEVAVPAEEKRFATWGTDIPDDLVLDQGKLAEALKKVYACVFVTR